VVVAEALHKLTADVALLQELRPAIGGALDWIDRRTGEGTRFLSYERRSRRGLDNQGWKDSRAGVPFPDGSFAAPPIALVEVQGYCVDAYCRAARIFRALGEPDTAERYEARGQAMRALIEREFWIDEAARYAFAIDGLGRKVDTVVSNLGHLLWSRVPSLARAAATASLLTDRHSFSGFGVRTLAEGQAPYNPLSYHNGTVWPHDNAIIAKGMSNYRLGWQATTVFEGLVAAMHFFRDHRIPELFCGFERSEGQLVPYPVACRPQAWSSAAPFLFLQSILGIHADGPNARLAIRNPSLPPSMQWIEIEGLRVGPARVHLGIRRFRDRCHVDRLDLVGGPLRTEIELD
jgi:glycogen debranching enzyme